MSLYTLSSKPASEVSFLYIELEENFEVLGLVAELLFDHSDLVDIKQFECIHS